MTNLENSIVGMGARPNDLESVRLRPVWHRPWVRNVITQLLAVTMIGIVVWSIFANVSANLPRSNLGFGFDFMNLPTRFEVGPNYLGATARDPVWMTFLVGLINTLRVSAMGIVLCTFVALIVALARLSDNWLVARTALIYVETVRNIPLLLQMLFWYGFSTLLPLPKQAWNPAAGVFVSNRGVYLPALQLTSVHYVAAVLFFAGAVGAIFVIRRRIRQRELTGEPIALSWAPLLMPFAFAAFALIAGRAGWVVDTPALSGFNFKGGGLVTPEFVAVLISLSVYQSGFAAETIRSGILSVRRGQVEAARSLGLKPNVILGKIVLPQAMRIIVPPMAGQYMSLTKNSSLAVVIGYPELVRVSTAVISETGRAIECITLLMAIYLSLSLLTSAFMNWYNRRIAFVEN